MTPTLLQSLEAAGETVAVRHSRGPYAVNGDAARRDRRHVCWYALPTSRGCLGDGLLPRWGIYYEVISARTKSSRTRVCLACMTGPAELAPGDRIVFVRAIMFEARPEDVVVRAVQAPAVAR